MRNKNGALTFIGKSRVLFSCGSVVLWYNFITHTGRYRDGAPDGWCWIFSPDDPNQESGALYVKFEHGVLFTSQAVWLDIANARAFIGEYSDGE